VERVPHQRLRATFDGFWLGQISETIRCRCYPASFQESFNRQADSRHAEGEQCDALLPLAIELSS